MYVVYARTYSVSAYFLPLVIRISGSVDLIAEDFQAGPEGLEASQHRVEELKSAFR